MPLEYINKPNFFILGAGKSGTTSLYFYLKDHPDIFLTEIKEPSFFCEGFQDVKNPIKYFELFDSVYTEKIIGESSHVYLSNPTTPKVLKALFPKSKFLVILRNPADRAYSLYHHMRRHGYEYIKSFEVALKKEELRYSSKKFVKNCPQYFYNYLYFRSGLYGKQLQKYFSIFPKHQFHIIKFEEFIVDPINHLKEIYTFLDVSTGFHPNIQVTNAGKMTTRFPKVQYYVKSKVANSRLVWKIMLYVLKKLNMIEIPPLRKETREFLLQRYSSDLQLLFHMTGISFSE